MFQNDDANLVDVHLTYSLFGIEGGFGSDLFNAKYGMRGRMTWQTLTLLLEGVAIVIFGYADTLAGSILALVFLSLMVQSAEGSTFGIVPYVDRRFTGRLILGLNILYVPCVLTYPYLLSQDRLLDG